MPEWIQAIAAIVVVVLTFLTLIVLRKYAADTKTIARASVVQIENAQTPFLALVRTRDRFGQPAEWVIENQGTGPAINVTVALLQSGSGVLSVPPIAPKAMSDVHSTIANSVVGKKAMQFDYEALSGSKYRTVITWEGEIIRTQFVDLQRRT